MNIGEIMSTVRSTQWTGESDNTANRAALLKPLMDLNWISFGLNPACQKNKSIYYMPCVKDCQCRTHIGYYLQKLINCRFR